MKEKENKQLLIQWPNLILQKTAGMRRNGSLINIIPSELNELTCNFLSY